MFKEVAAVLTRSRATAIGDGLGVVLLFSMLVVCLNLSTPI